MTIVKPRMQLPFYDWMNRKKRQMLSQFLRVKGLNPLLMKPRNNQQWTRNDKRELILYLKSLSHMGVSIALLVMPGGFIILPVMAWWLDRRRGLRVVPQAQ